MSLTQLEQIILARQSAPTDTSYTSRLLTLKGLAERKVHEETFEVVEAAFNSDRTQLIYEASDLLYHLLVLLRKYDISLADIDQELQRRRKQ